jgi:Holliday junction resolvasome RuvABC ATP-dependent DNA helicase subunit
MPTTMEPKKYIELNCATIKNLRQFVEMIMIPYMQNEEATFLFDECHMLPKDVTMALLTITNPNKHNFNTFSYEGSDIDIDFKKLTFLFATTEPQEVFHALIDRMERIDLDDYTYDELGQILLLNTEKIRFSGDIVSKHIAPALRGNGRAAQKMATNIKSYVAANNTKTFKLSDWNELCRILDIMPHGLNKIELRYLRTLHREGTVRLYNLAAKLQMTRAAIQSDAEVYLQKLNFIDVSTHGRALSNDAKLMFDKNPELLEKQKSS